MDVTRVVPRAGFVVAAAMMLALATASAASAQSTVGKNAGGNGIVYTDPGSNVDMVFLAWAHNPSTDTDEHAIGFDDGTAPISNGTGCSDAGALIFCGSTMESLTATLGGENDILDLTQVAAADALPTTVTGGSGNDKLLGGALADDFGGGSGNDTLVGLTNGDEYRGQDGTDTLDLTGAAGATITLNDTPDDGPGTGGSANVGSDVEVVLGGAGNDDFTGGLAAQTLDGGGGDDVIEGGAGADELRAGPGADTILAQDDVVDVIGCGDGDDTVFADWNDTVAPGCETVSRSARDDDGDGSPAGVDCNDANPNVRPGRGDIPGNGVDDD
ncbi:MAG: calcium-binding protein, partial [Solirubrobacteraceae bacterium]